MERRRKRIDIISQELAQEAYKAYTGKKDYKKALEIYTLLANSRCVPKENSSFSKNMLGRLGKKIQDTHK